MERDILADNCHINPDTPHLEKSTPQALKDFAADVLSTTTDGKVLREIGGGALSEVTTTSGALRTAGSVGVGVAARAVGGVLAAELASAYLLGREGAELVINGPEAAADDTWSNVTAPFHSVGKVYDAAQIVHNNDTSHPDQLAAAKLELRSAGASILPVLGMTVGGASGDLGPRALRAATQGAQSTAMIVGRATLGEPFRMEPAYAGALPNPEILGAVKGSPTIPVAVAASEGTVVLNQNMGGEGGSDSKKNDGVRNKDNTGKMASGEAADTTQIESIKQDFKIDGLADPNEQRSFIPDSTNVTRTVFDKRNGNRTREGIAEIVEAKPGLVLKCKIARDFDGTATRITKMVNGTMRYENPEGVFGANTATMVEVSLSDGEMTLKAVAPRINSLNPKPDPVFQNGAVEVRIKYKQGVFEYEDTTYGKPTTVKAPNGIAYEDVVGIYVDKYHNYTLTKRNRAWYGSGDHNFHYTYDGELDEGF
jgi:hypothetical protein